MDDGVHAEGLAKSFGDTRALDGVDLHVPEASVLGLLGPNGAGKTTTVRILCTLLSADAGQATVAGYDVFTQAASVRASIGLTGQYAAVDENLTGAENLEMVGRLSQLRRAEAVRRTRDLLQRFDLADAANRPAKTYSGGMSRRLDLAASLIAQPRVLFLDEPTTGLDPSGRRGMWQVIRELVGEGTTLMLTTQYLEEADQLADRIAVIDRGNVIAEGTAAELKAQVGGEIFEFEPADPDQADAAVRAVSELADGEIELHHTGGRTTVSLPLGQDRSLMATAMRRLDEAEIGLADIGMRRPSLDDVFFSLTGQAPTNYATDQARSTEQSAA
jgi:ABC-2 type transport system ATP-binding protein